MIQQITGKKEEFLLFRTEKRIHRLLFPSIFISIESGTKLVHNLIQNMDKKYSGIQWANVFIDVYKRREITLLGAELSTGEKDSPYFVTSWIGKFNLNAVHLVEESLDELSTLKSSSVPLLLVSQSPQI